MPRSPCPDPALLQAHVDETLFSRDVSAIEAHVASCERCAAIISAMRQQREATPASTTPPPRVAGVALAVFAFTSIAVWTMRSGSNDTRPSETQAVAQPKPPAIAAPAPAAPITTPEKPPELAVAPAPPPAQKAEAPQPVTEKVVPADVTEPADVAGTDGSVIVRGGRQSNRRVMWRARDVVIEYSTDGGTTWATEYKTDRPVRSGAFVSADVVWLAGDSGLVLRRTTNGWFGTTPPAEGNIKSIRASSAIQASVTFDDGRVFSTENGGATWSLGP